KQAKEAMGVEKLEATTDIGYYDCNDVKQCEEQGITIYMQKPPAGKMKKKGLFSKEQFSYHPEKDVYLCSPGNELENKRKGTENGEPTRYYTTRSSRTCVRRSRCREGVQRRITRLGDEEVWERMAARVRTGSEKLRISKGLVENPFWTIKRAMGQ